MPPSRSPYSYNNDKSRRYSQSNFSIGTCLSVLASFIAFINIIQYFSDQSIWTLFQPINGAGIVRSLLHSNCKDFHPECRFQSEQGFCSEYEPAMSVECPRSCSTCDLIDYDTRCTDERLYPDESDLPPSLYIEDVFIKGNSLFKKGGLTKMFSTIQTRVGFKYKVTIKSISPWIVTLDNFLSDAEVEKLTSGLEAWQPFPKSEIDKNLFSGDVITCRDECRNANSLIYSKLSEVVEGPMGNMDGMEVFKYSEGDSHKVHHEFYSSFVSEFWGSRAVSAMLFLSDVEEGGDTVFDQLNIRIKPVKGQAVFYATTLDESPDAIDYKTQHISEPVIKGTKLVANVHVYEFNFVKAEAWRCFEPREIPEPTPDQQQAIPGAQQQQQQQPKQIVPGLRTDI